MTNDPPFDPAKFNTKRFETRPNTKSDRRLHSWDPDNVDSLLATTKEKTLGSEETELEFIIRLESLIKDVHNRLGSRVISHKAKDKMRIASAFLTKTDNDDAKKE